jgi:hypothetical protein
MLICYATTSFHHTAFACCYSVFPYRIWHVLMLVVILYCIYTTRLLPRRTLWRRSWRVRRFLGERATSQLPVETSFSAVGTRFLILSLRFWHCFWYSLSRRMCVTWSWRTCVLCIRVCLETRVWHCAPWSLSQRRAGEEGDGHAQAATARRSLASGSLLRNSGGVCRPTTTQPMFMKTATDYEMTHRWSSMMTRSADSSVSR